MLRVLPGMGERVLHDGVFETPVMPGPGQGEKTGFPTGGFKHGLHIEASL
jgi:hypothetical protein